MTQFNPWGAFLEDQPQAAYYARTNQFGDSPRQRSYFLDNFNDIYHQYLGSLGRQVLAGTVPTGNFNDYLSGFDFTNWYRQQVPYPQRIGRFPEGYSGFVPPVQWRIPGVNG